MDRNVLQGLMQKVNVYTLENVKGIESKIKSFSYFYHVALFNIEESFRIFRKFKLSGVLGPLVGTFPGWTGCFLHPFVSSMVSSLI